MRGQRFSTLEEAVDACFADTSIRVAKVLRQLVQTHAKPSQYYNSYEHYLLPLTVYYILLWKKKKKNENKILQLRCNVLLSVLFKGLCLKSFV